MSKPAPSTTIVVTNTNDSGSGSLRDALAIANDGDIINATGISGTILLTSGELQITHNVTIDGPGAGNLAVNGNGTSRVFENFASDVTISGFTITNGRVTNGGLGAGIFNNGGLTLSDSSIVNNAADGGGGISNAAIQFCCPTLTMSSCTISGNLATNFGSGGGIFNNNGAVTLNDCILSGNSAYSGAGIENLGANGLATLTITTSTVSGNSATFGGGIGTVGFDGNATLSISNSTISGNLASSNGGGISTGAGGSVPASSRVTISSSTISGNSAGTGGGIDNGPADGFATLTIANSTLSDNSAGNGGGIFNGVTGFGAATLTITSSTLSGNSAGVSGGGIYNDSGQQGGVARLDLGSTVLNAGSSGENIFNNAGTVTSFGYNLSSDDGGGVLTGPGDQINTDPMLGPLQDNGGPTYTHELLPGSPAINAGDPSFTPPPDFDQRGPGFPRVVNSRIDIGSFEVQCPSIWVERAHVPYSAAGMFAVSDGTYVYVGGGSDPATNIFYADLWKYDPRNDSWTPLPHSPDAHALSQAVYFNGKIYDIGGWVSASGTTDVTRIYDIGTNTWTTGAPMPVALGSMATVLWNGVIYVAGGYEPGIGVVNTLYAYDIAGDTWTTLEPMLQAMNYPGFGVIDGKLYIAGGTTPCCYLNTLYIYDIANHTWTPGANLPLGIRGSGCAVLNGKLYLYGGQLLFTMTNHTWIYDPDTDSWSPGPDMNVGRGFLYGTAVGDDSIVAPGGLDINFNGLDDNEQLTNTPCGTPTPTPTPTLTPTPTATPTPTPRSSPTPRPRPTSHPRL